MKRKSLYILLAISFTCTMFSSCKKNDSIETVNIVEETVNTIESESVMEETETTTIEEVESTVEVIESTEETETATEEVYSTEEPTTVDEYEGISTSDQEAIEDMAQQLIVDYLKEHAQDNQIEVDVPGGTPASEATEQESNLGKGGELPPELQGSVTQ